MNCLRYTLLTLIFCPFAFFLRPFVFLKLWEYFFVTTFGLNELSFVQSLGIIVSIGFVLSFLQSGFTRYENYLKNEEYDKAFQFFMGQSIVGPLMVWIVGYCISLFM